MDKIAKLLARAVDPELYKIDPSNSQKTIPETYGTFSIPDEALNGEEKFRIGNYPVRMAELKREFGEVVFIALFENRDDAETLAGMLKNL